MPCLARTAAALLTFAFIVTAHAQARPLPVNPPKLAPKISSVTQNANAAALAAQLVGAGVTISNARFVGNANAAGTFVGGVASIGMDTGVVLSTGKAEDARGPNEASDWSEIMGTPGDGQLDALVAPEVTFDAAILEFDVTPLAATIGIRFVFASEEYQEFVGSPFNDVIAIFVNGVNCANYSGRPVSVNSINADVNSALFINNESGARNTEFDGLTVPLECVAAVTPGVPNRVKIAIADTADEIYDAAVFLATGGVRSPGTGAVTGSNVIKAIEYYHAAFNHYFVTANPQEIELLNAGAFAGWTRTGKAFNVFTLGTPGTLDVHRFFSGPLVSTLISTHFYTSNANEAAGLSVNPKWVFEAKVFGIMPAVPACPTGMIALLRLYNGSMGGVPNHRFLVDVADLNFMVAAGWIQEGDYGMAGCVPL
ncbi:MAG: choice-of-anchor L domain-containing protein [Burkholderiales bacterium]|nr:choice-of-anchor L domain-containing protein [Burkholderiales bacterium]